MKPQIMRLKIHDSLQHGSLSWNLQSMKEHDALTFSCPSFHPQRRRHRITSRPNWSSAAISLNMSSSLWLRLIHIGLPHRGMTSQVLTMRVSNARISMDNSSRLSGSPRRQKKSFRASFNHESPDMSSCLNFCSILSNVCFNSVWTFASYDPKFVASGLLWSDRFNPKWRHINNSRADCWARHKRVTESESSVWQVLLVKSSRAELASFTASFALWSLSASKSLVNSNFSPKSSSTSARAESNAIAGSIIAKDGGEDIWFFSTFAFGLATQRCLGGWVVQSCFVLFQA